jgi:hypothetical protein
MSKRPAILVKNILASKLLLQQFLPKNNLEEKSRIAIFFVAPQGPPLSGLPASSSSNLTFCIFSKLFFWWKSLLLLILCLTLSGCCSICSKSLEPHLRFEATKTSIRLSPSPFPPLSQEEAATDWGRELRIASSFGKEIDLYQALTGYKRALVLLPSDNKARRLELQYHILTCYYLGEKWHEALEYFEESDLATVTSAFPAFEDLLIILYDTYRHCGEGRKAKEALDLLEKGDARTARDLKLFTAIDCGNLPEISALSQTNFLREYCSVAKSPARAQMLNALLPGAGYWYVEQHQSAITAFLLNSLFIAATYQLASHHYFPAAILTGSLEVGWYLGGIQGAGLAAKQWNECHYNRVARSYLQNNCLFPFLMINVSF